MLIWTYVLDRCPAGRSNDDPVLSFLVEAARFRSKMSWHFMEFTVPCTLTMSSFYAKPTAQFSFHVTIEVSGVFSAYVCVKITGQAFFSGKPAKSFVVMEETSNGSFRDLITPRCYF